MRARVKRIFFNRSSETSEAVAVRGSTLDSSCFYPVNRWLECVVAPEIACTRFSYSNSPSALLQTFVSVRSSFCTRENIMRAYVSILRRSLSRRLLLPAINRNSVTSTARNKMEKRAAGRFFDASSTSQKENLSRYLDYQQNVVSVDVKYVDFNRSFYFAIFLKIRARVWVTREHVFETRRVKRMVLHTFIMGHWRKYPLIESNRMKSLLLENRLRDNRCVIVGKHAESSFYGKIYIRSVEKGCGYFHALTQNSLNKEECIILYPLFLLV